MTEIAMPKPPPREFWDDDKWIVENITSLSKSYPDQWIAVVDRKVVSSGDNLREVIDKAKQLTGRNQIPTHFVEKGVRAYQD